MTTPPPPPHSSECGTTFARDLRSTVLYPYCTGTWYRYLYEPGIFALSLLGLALFVHILHHQREPRREPIKINWPEKDRRICSSTHAPARMPPAQPLAPLYLVVITIFAFSSSPLNCEESPSSSSSPPDPTRPP